MKRAALLMLLASCGDALDQRLAIVTEPRVLAVIADPAEAKPNSVVTYRAVIAGPSGPVGDVPHFAYCLSPKPPTEDNAASVNCIAGKELVELGTATEVMGTLPMDGCARFGPDTPGQGFRPRDPDASGGYYQPVRVDAGDLLAIGLSRITCKLPTAPGEVARQYDLNYVANANPTLDPIAVVAAPPNSDVTLTASWPSDSVESYLYYDSLSQTLVSRRESMRVSWFATGGSLTVDASAVGEDDTAASVSTTWHTPASGTAHVWFVLRDSRGGISVQMSTVQLR